MLTTSFLHHFILEYIIDHGHSPSIGSIAASLNIREKVVVESLFKLESQHGVVLHPNSNKIWVIHPFSLAPTHFIVRTKSGSWWGSCAWCSLGIAALLKEDLVISTHLGAEGDPISIHIRNGQIKEKDLLVHFPITMKNAWDNVIYTCQTMLIFYSEDEIDRWCKHHDIPKGDVQPITTIWEMSKIWYGNHLDPKWEKWTVEEAKKIFEQFELTHPIWDLEDSKQRF